MNIFQLWNNNGKLGMIVYSPTGNGAELKCAWSDGDMGEGWGAIEWLAVDANGDGRTDIVQLWDHNGSLAWNVYSPTGTGAAYGLAWSTPDIGAGVAAVKWLAADVTGDGRTDVVQLWNNNGQLGVTVYSPTGNGVEYKVAWSTTDIGKSVSAVEWLAVDVTGDGRTDIVQLWNNNGKLGMIVYSPTGNGAEYKVAWSDDDMGEGWGAIEWLTVDATGDRRTDIVQLWNHNSRLAWNVYSPTGTGAAYSLGWSNPDIGEGVIAVEWLAADLAGDGRTDIAQLWNNNGRLAVIVYSPTGNGVEYKVAGSDDDMGEGPDAVEWLTGDVTGDGRTDIVQLWNNNGKLGMIVYSSTGTGGDFPVAWSTTDIGQGPGAVAWLTGK